jgi:hypothetical protein
MGLTVHPGTMPGGMTPICNSCGICLCWDISKQDAARDAAFWEAWVCQDCNGGVRLSLPDWRLNNQQGKSP